jgi:CBS domain-containing protein
MKPVGTLIEGQQMVVVPRGASVAEAAREMADHHIGAVPVVDGNRLVGIFTERDLLTRVVAAGRDPAATPVRDVMTTELVMASPDESYEDCLRRMQQAGIRHLLVLRDGHLAGVLSLRDLLRLEADEKEEMITLLNAYVHDIPVVLARRL